MFGSFPPSKREIWSRDRHALALWTQKAIRLSKTARSALEVETRTRHRPVEGRPLSRSASNSVAAPTPRENHSAAGFPSELRSALPRCAPACVGLAGGADRDRTDDLRLAKPALSQLSYSPQSHTHTHTRHTRQSCRAVVGLGRFELPTSRLSGGRSNQLSYRPAPKLLVCRAPERPGRLRPGLQKLNSVRNRVRQAVGEFPD